MAFDFKKEYKEYYMPKNTPEIVTVPKANYIAVRGKGNPNEEGGAYQQAVSVLYAVAYTLKMSYKTDYKIEGFFEYVVPPLEGFWWQDNVDGVDYSDKSTFNWISVIRLPDFVSKEDFEWAVATAAEKKKIDCSSAEFLTVDEGLCVQIMHYGSFDDEPATVALMDEYSEANDNIGSTAKECADKLQDSEQKLTETFTKEQAELYRELTIDQDIYIGMTNLEAFRRGLRIGIELMIAMRKGRIE